MAAQQYIQHLNLQPHPEGGLYKETYQSPEIIDLHQLPDYFTGERHLCTAIYYLLREAEYSAFHRIKSDEIWHFYAGGSLIIHVIDPNGQYYHVKLGNNFEQQEHFQIVIPARARFAAELLPGKDFALVGCTVSPGFDFVDFELGNKEILLNQYPDHAIIHRLSR